jgi:hypothetical protein
MVIFLNMESLIVYLQMPLGALHTALQVFNQLRRYLHGGNCIDLKRFTQVIEVLRLLNGEAPQVSSTSRLPATLTGMGLDTTATLTPASATFGSIYAGGGTSAAQVFTL